MEVNLNSFSGGMNLLVDDTRLGPSEYHTAFNIRNRFDVLDQINDAVEIKTAPVGIKQGLYTFGDFVILFCAGLAYYKFRTQSNFVQIPAFKMNPSAPRVFIAVVPVTTTLYGRAASLMTNPTDGSPIAAVPAPAGAINLISIAASALGNNPGVIVQDGVSQPWFMYFNQPTNSIVAREIQKYSEWAYDPTGVNDKREYVPVGTFMEWFDGILFIVAPDTSTIYRSVSGRPLDFVVNVTPTLADGTGGGDKGGDATTTAYGVGIGGITCLRAMNDGSLFVAASGVCYSVTVNRNPGAPTIFGEPTFIRTFLFSATCLSDRAIVDILGDTAFIDPEGLRSFNAVLQTENEGRNSIFSLKVASLFKNIIQTTEGTSSIVFDNYALFGVNTTYGYVILVYDTLSKCFTGIDTQTNGASIKQFAKISTDTTAVYCITGDNKVMQLYAAVTFAPATARLQSVCGTDTSSGIGVQSPKMESQLIDVRCVLSKFVEDSTVSMTAFVNNRLSVATMTKQVPFRSPTTPYTGTPTFNDIDTQVSNLAFPITNADEGWKTFIVLSWTGGGSITNVYMNLKDSKPMESLKTQSLYSTNKG